MGGGVWRVDRDEWVVDVMRGRVITGYGEGMQRTNGCLSGLEPGMRHAIPNQVEVHTHFASFFTKPVNRVNTVYEVHVNP